MELNDRGWWKIAVCCCDIACLSKTFLNWSLVKSNLPITSIYILFQNVVQNMAMSLKNIRKIRHQGNKIMCRQGFVTFKLKISFWEISSIITTPVLLNENMLCLWYIPVFDIASVWTMWLQSPYWVWKFYGSLWFLILAWHCFLGLPLGL